MNRYNVNFEDRLIEPSPDGRWVKHTDVESVEAEADARAEKAAEQRHQELRKELKARGERIAELLKARDQTEEEGKTASHTVDVLSERLREAKARIKLLGHSPNCQSRYSQTSADGSQTVGECNCGLNDWFRENGIG